MFNRIRDRLSDPLRLLMWAQFVVGAFVVLGFVFVLSRPNPLDPSRSLETVGRLYGLAVFVVLPVTVVMGLSFPASSALLPDDIRRAGTSSGSLLAANTIGAIAGSFLVPFLLVPTMGSPRALTLIAVANVMLGLALARLRWRRGAATNFRAPMAGGGVLLAIALIWSSPGLLRQPTEALVDSFGGVVFASSEDEIASVQAGQVRSTPELWVAGTSMTLLTVDARLMPVLPLIARPESGRALIVAFGMGSSFRSALSAGMRTDAVELVPSVPKMFGYYYPDADQVLADPDGRVIIADGRNHLELTSERFDIIVTDPPPPIESSGASVISSREYYEAGRAHLTDRGVMMQWMPWGSTIDEYKDHLRTFASVFPEVTVVFGPGGYGSFMLGSSSPVTFDDAVAREVLARPGILEDISGAYDSPASDIDGWLDVIHRQTWLSGDAVRAFVGNGPEITDDRPLPEYFLLRRLGEGNAVHASPGSLLGLAPASP